MAHRVLFGNNEATGDVGIFVTKAGANVLDPAHMQNPGNYAFNSSEASTLGVLKAIQTGTFQITCKKTLFGKRGPLELSPDEAMRANSDYVARYPWDLETVTPEEYLNYILNELPKGVDSDPTVPGGFAQMPGYLSDSTEESVLELSKSLQIGSDRNFSIRRRQTGAVVAAEPLDVPIEPPGIMPDLPGPRLIHPKYIANVYCDFGRTTIEFTPALPKNLKTPHVSVFFAVANSAGHFHPWYANVICDNSDYNWEYANSQHCVHVDSAWFRGKWSFRERTMKPLGGSGWNFPISHYNFPSDGEVTAKEKAAGIGNVKVNNKVNNTPHSVWGGMFKCFAGLQGLIYEANNTHLTLDGFMTPTHSPTPFHTNIDRTRIIQDGDYKEQLPRTFRTTYLDGYETEYDWVPSGHLGHIKTDGNRGETDGGYDPEGTGTTYAPWQKMIEYPEGNLRGQGESVLAFTPQTSIMPGLGFQRNRWRRDQGASGHAVVHSKGTRFPTGLPLTTEKSLDGPPGLSMYDGSAYNSQGRNEAAEQYGLNKYTGETYSNHQYDPGDVFMHTRTFQGQPTSLDSFWNSFSNNMSQWVSSNTPYGEFHYADGGYAMDMTRSDQNYKDGAPTANGIGTTMSLAKHNWHGGNIKAAAGTEGRRFGFGGAGSTDSVGTGGFDTYIGTYVVYDIQGGSSDG